MESGVTAYGCVGDHAVSCRYAHLATWFVTAEHVRVRPQMAAGINSRCSSNTTTHSTLSKPMALLMSSVADGIPATRSCMTCSAKQQ